VTSTLCFIPTSPKTVFRLPLPPRGQLDILVALVGLVSTTMAPAMRKNDQDGELSYLDRLCGYEGAYAHQSAGYPVEPHGDWAIL